MKIWVDADACPAVIKETLFRAAQRTRTQVTLVANHSMRVPPSRYVSFVQVTHGFDVADAEIVKRLDAGDLVITADIPLAAEVIEKGGQALSPRGELYSPGRYQSAADDAGFHGHAAVQRHRHGRPAGLEPGRSPGVREPSGFDSRAGGEARSRCRSAENVNVSSLVVSGVHISRRVGGDSMRADKVPLPLPSSRVDYVEVAA